MQKFHGTMSHQNPIKAVPKIWEKHHETGKYDGRDGHSYSTRLSVWVPEPRHGEHKAGIFLRIANPSGFAYTRLTGSEFAELYTFFRHVHAPAIQAFAEAESKLLLYRDAERALMTGQEAVKYTHLHDVADVHDNQTESDQISQDLYID